MNGLQMMDTELKNVDMVFVGASPLNVLLATKHTRAGNRCLIIEKSTTFGGCWKNVSLKFPFKVECAVHLLSRPSDPAFFQRLESDFGIETFVMHPQPKRHYQGGFIDYEDPKGEMKKIVSDIFGSVIEFLVKKEHLEE